MRPTYPDSIPRDIMCQACPNGCHLRVDNEGFDQIRITGNQCQKGVDYALQFIPVVPGALPSAPSSPSAERNRPVHAAAENPDFHSPEDLMDVAAQWGLKLKTTLPQFDIAGSPERSLFRTVFEDTAGHHYILEHIPTQSQETRTRIAETLAYLRQQGLGRIRTYLPDQQNRYLRKHKGHVWQIAPFIPGTELNRQAYLYEKWRGTRLADFLIALRNKTVCLPFFNPAEPFSIKTYLLQLFQIITRYHSPLAQTLHPVILFLEKNFFRIYDTFPTAFCHGDYHPLNVIWDTNDIKAVIDWEFTGYKPEIYDAANMIGCIGVEHPSGLFGELVSEFIGRLQEARLMQDVSWDYLVEFILAVRFAWLSEWLRKTDTDMIEMETVYMKLLIEEKSRLMDAWF